MSDWLDETFYLPVQTEIDRAVNYPYDAPDTAFVFDNGRLRAFDDARILDERTAVLSVGSNRAPVQLRRKFGDAAIIPVTPAVLHDCDIVHAAQLGYYGAVPCTAFPAAGCEVRLNVAWLTRCSWKSCTGPRLSVLPTTISVSMVGQSHIFPYQLLAVRSFPDISLSLAIRRGVAFSMLGRVSRQGLSRISAKNRIFPDNESGRGRQTCTPAHGQ